MNKKFMLLSVFVCTVLTYAKFDEKVIKLEGSVIQITLNRV
ncbi:MAG: hypothetical protein ACRCW5_05720 [Cetobacterium sp.]